MLSDGWGTILFPRFRLFKLELSVCACVCLRASVCERDRESDRERERKMKREREGGKLTGARVIPHRERERERARRVLNECNILQFFIIFETEAPIKQLQR